MQSYSRKKYRICISVVEDILVKGKEKIPLVTNVILTQVWEILKHGSN